MNKNNKSLNYQWYVRRRIFGQRPITKCHLSQYISIKRKDHRLMTGYD